MRLPTWFPGRRPAAPRPPVSRETAAVLTEVKNGLDQFGDLYFLRQRFYKLMWTKDATAQLGPKDYAPLFLDRFVETVQKGAKGPVYRTQLLNAGDAVMDAMNKARDLQDVVAQNPHALPLLLGLVRQNADDATKRVKLRNLLREFASHQQAGRSREARETEDKIYEGVDGLTKLSWGDGKDFTWELRLIKNHRWTPEQYDRYLNSDASGPLSSMFTR